ncbi:MAG: preprotein translocase subunit YajC [Planctomycetota bacterium]
MLPLLTLAQDDAAASGGFGRMLIPILLMFGVFYVVMILPERKKQKKRTAMLGAMKKGDRVMTTSGILAKVVGVSDDEVRLEIADGVRVRFSRQAIQMVLDSATASAKDAGQPALADGGETQASS